GGARRCAARSATCCHGDACLTRRRMSDVGLRRRVDGMTTTDWDAPHPHGDDAHHTTRERDQPTALATRPRLSSGGWPSGENWRRLCASVSSTSQNRSNAKVLTGG